VYLSSAVQGAGQQSLLQTPLMDAAEQQLVLQGFNNTNLEYDRQTFVHGQFMQRARETPDAPCVVYEDYVFSYAEVSVFSQKLQQL
jgi:non-ribosomal peptide synthetase component F